MITDIYYWTFLAVGVAASFFLAEKYRFVFQSLLSIAFLLLIACNIGSETNSAAKTTLSSPLKHVVHFLSISFFIYYCCEYYKSKKHWQFIQIFLISGVVGYLIFHKYIPVLGQYIAGKPLDSNFLIPLGISYFSFKLIHYIIERGRNTFDTHSLWEFLAYVFMFPIFTAGPIERFDHFQQNWTSDNRKNDLIVGSTRIIYGLIKKFVISGIILTTLLNHNTAETLLLKIDILEQYKFWAFFLITYLIIYVDFSAYSDIAIGSARMMGFRIMENFNWPILAPNIAELWKRWHMSLSSWCQSYVYLPAIGITRNPYLAVLATFLAVGLWHGGTLTWIAWGLYQGAGVSAYVAWIRFLRTKRWKIPSNMVTRIISTAITNFWMAGSFAFTISHTDGSWSDMTDALRLLQRYFFLI